MEYFTEDHANHMLGTEWLVKVDPDQSKSYLFKFANNDGKLCLMVTDTIQLWAEVLAPHQLARRWSARNPSVPIHPYDNSAGLGQRLRLLSDAHTAGGMGDIAFRFSDSPSCDACMSLECDTGDEATSWCWSWELFSAGPKLGAQLLSQHLIVPLISVMHLAFQSNGLLNELSNIGLEQVVDKMARTARRAMDSHVKQVMSRPRTATTLRRVTAMIYEKKTLPIISEIEDINLEMTGVLRKPKSGIVNGATATEQIEPSDAADHVSRRSSYTFSAKADAPELISVENSSLPPKSRGKLVRRAARLMSPSLGLSRSNSPVHTPPAAATPDKDIEMRPAPSGSDTEESDNEVLIIPPPAPGPTVAPAHLRLPTQSPGLSPASIQPPVPKKARSVSPSSDSDESEAERRRHVARMVGSSKRGGARQPIKRGGKRF